jgi:hypothetical protein
MRDGLKSKVEQSAAAQQRSISEEIEARLERSFTTEAGFGGPEMTRLAYLMASSFAVAGQRDAAGKSDWIADPRTYGNGVAAVLDALLIGFPNGEEKALALKALIGRLLSRIEREREESK